jgi:transglutaminase-like putative cysteine protease
VTPPSARARRARPTRGAVNSSTDDLATIALTFLTLVTALGMGRLFADGAYLAPVCLAALVVHGVAWGCRRTGLGALTTLPACLGVLGLVVAWTVLPDSTIGGIPWTGTWRAALDSLTQANQQFGQVVAPVKAEDGFVLAAALGVGLVALMADWAAFRVRSTWESIVPAFGLFVFTSLLGADRWRWLAICGQLVAILAVVCTHWARARVSSTPWLGTRAGKGWSPAGESITPLLSGAAVLTALAVAAAVLVGPRLPGANDPPLIGVREEADTGPGKRTTISPLVDIRGRLTERSEKEAFTVKATTKAYWRLTALDEFDGNIWSSNDSYQRAGDRLERFGPRPRDFDEIEQEYSITELASIWLPAAYQASSIEGIEGVSYNAESGSAISRFPTTDGLTYTVRSERPSLTRAELTSGSALAPASLASHTALPPNIPPRVAQLAASVVGAAGAEDPFSRALALQNHLRDNFTYDINIDQGHGGSALETFLFETRRGYCEQFAGSFAVLARLVGLPSRVAVGFTPGEFDQGTGRYRVRGIHAHAWPEVFINGVGWVLFEPTPGRGAPGAEAYTGVAEQQEAGGGGEIPATTLAPSEAGGTEAPAQPEATTTTTTTPEAEGSTPLGRNFVIALVLLAVIGLVAGIWVAAVPLIRRTVRRRRRASATSPVDRVLLAWTEADEALRLTRARRRPAETLAEHARRAGGSVPADARQALERLASHATSASYAQVLTPEVVPKAVADAEEVERAVWQRADRATKLKRALDPRP